MSVLYVPANDMLHAFRAGPCPSAAARCAASTVVESGGEELWAFVPHDLLYKLKDKMKPQTRTDHTFMMAASLRFADVFLPGNVSVAVTGRTYALTGRWRRLMMFGRGIGGKHYTVLDITGTGSMSRGALETPLPAVLWNRGNPDTNTGLPSGTRNGSPTDLGLYLDMGQTWSTPAIARVDPTTNAGREFVAYVGSGYSTTDPREGTRFYTLDPFNGDIVASADVGDGQQTAFDNALVANPVIFSASRLVGGVDLPHPATPINESVFIGDIHGGVWKFESRDPGTALQFRDLGSEQPVGAAAALLNLGAPFVFVETGRDARVPARPRASRCSAS
jgi:Tfp pilus tip-associated adhesin PilY1